MLAFSSNQTATVIDFKQRNSDEGDSTICDATEQYLGRYVTDCDAQPEEAKCTSFFDCAASWSESPRRGFILLVMCSALPASVCCWV